MELKRLVFRRRIVLSVILILLVILTGYYFYSIHNSLNQPYPWLFKGAYSVYIGSGTIKANKLVTVTATIKLFIGRINSTHYHLYFLQVFEYSSTGESVEKLNDTWVPINNPDYYPIEKYRLAKTYHARIKHPKLGVREAIVYVYTSSLNATVEVYVDAKAKWPIAYVFKDYLGMGKPLIVELKAYNIKL